jgi:hypothetical protein
MLYPESPTRRAIPAIKSFLSLALALLMAVTAVAQQLPPSPDATTESGGKDDVHFTVPAGTRLALVLAHPVDSKALKRGDEVHAQNTAPVTSGDQVAIPAGTFLQGPIEKISRHGSRGEFILQSLSVVYANGYVAKIAGPVTIESDEGTAGVNPSGGAKTVALLAPLIGLGIGAGIGSAAHTTDSHTLAGNTITSSSLRGVAIGSAVGMGAGAIVAFALLLRSHQFYVDAGSPMQMTLPQPLLLSQGQVAGAVKQAVAYPVIPVAKPKAQQNAQISPWPTAPSATVTGTCYTPGTPATYIPGTPGTGGTPDIFIPGTPAMGESPGTADTYIRGTPGTGGTPGTYIPGTPPVPHPCP